MYGVRQEMGRRRALHIACGGVCACARGRLGVRSTSPGTLVVGRHTPRQGQLWDQRGLPGPPPAPGCSLPHLLLQQRPTGRLWGDGFHRTLARKWLLHLLLRRFLRGVFLFLFLFLGPLLGKRQPCVKQKCRHLIL